MRQILLTTILILFFVVSHCFAELTDAEQGYLEDAYTVVVTALNVNTNARPLVIAWLSANPSVDWRKIVFTGTDVQKKALIKSYFLAVGKPLLEAEIDKKDAEILKLEALKTAQQAWADAN